MKRIILNVIFLVIFTLASLYIYKGLLMHFSESVDLIDKAEYEKMYYYKTLTEEQKNIFIKLDKGIDLLEEKIKVGFVELKDIRGEMDLVLKALYNDRPEYYFLPEEYNVRTIRIINSTYVIVEFKYEISSKIERERKDRELSNAIQQLLNNVVSDDMTDMEKEIAIHDEFAENVKYFNYEKMSDIPHGKHTSYAALVEKEAVCDGISKAMQLLLNEAGVETTIAFGEIDAVAHAWNIVRLDDEYYHLDTTSNLLKIDGEDYVIHNNVNLSDEQLEKTHSVSDEFPLPSCTGSKYNYYIYYDYEIKYAESMKSKLAKIINAQANRGILEVKVEELYSTQNLLEALYFIDFNNWQTNGESSIKYHKLNDVYVFKNELKKRIV